MNWFKKLLPKSIRIEGVSRRSVPEGLWDKCSNCGAVLYRPELERNQKVCMKCGHHNRIGARKRLDYFFDEGSSYEIGTEVHPRDFLKFKDEGAMLCPNIRQNVPCIMGSGDDNTYYDSLSLVDKFGIQCMTWASNPFYDEADRAKYEQGLPIEVTAAFGGFVLIKTDTLNKNDIEWYSKGGLEHWGLCARIKDVAKKKIIFLPSVKVKVEIPQKEVNKHIRSMDQLKIVQQQRLAMSSWERQISSNDIMQGYV